MWRGALVDMTLFYPLSVEEELKLIEQGSLAEIWDYVKPLVQSAVRNNSVDAARVVPRLRSELGIAVQRYLRNRRHTHHRFAVYFTWYVQRAVNEEE